MGTRSIVSTNEPQISPDDEPVPVKVVFASMVGVWLCYFLLITLRGAIVGLEFQDELLWRRALVCLIGVGVTALLWLCLRVVEQRSLGIKIAVALIASMPGAIMIAQANRWVFDSIEEKVEQQMGKDRGIALRRDDAGNLLIDLPRTQMNEDVEDVLPQSVLIAPAPTALDQWKMTFDLAIGRYFLLLAWAALFLALLAGAQARAAERRGERFRSAAKAAELRSLRYQVNPHFLFNTFNSLSALVMTGKAERAEQMIQTISRFYRHSLADDSTGDVTLEDEIDLQEHYLEIESVRFPERLRVRVDLPTELAGYKVPGMILQPLVENSVKYGVSVSSKPVTISITAREEYGRLVLTVSDDGPGSAGDKHGFGIGLANVRDRIEARFGNAATIVSGATLTGYETELRLPMVKHG
ncbi:MAG: histidine kinase [Erythrobacter sp.]|jgi:signal transduction histidine kinase|uniref:sensor histidine kinase n=1 Tax=Qipengyuania pacifica TaxID=2860199 RepID=UPI000C54E7BF|nr:sensor histidine kinase [Sphingomonadaceae bacterium]MAP68521.1 sensor histidine kinase [Erythrobacteraceae bacterium]MCH2497250.1 histidine kinase [Erythrobacter sp.]MEC7954046.1 histidine kinase [Pseudomonadota bacterium]|tara:strand:- start:984 stop:2219 length:1236 start_codon:yes stop_codon:yes gene_type:complete